MKQYEFPCGCVFDVISEFSDKVNGPLLRLDIEKVPLNCKLTWDLISSGRTTGVFQLETSGKFWSKKIKPENIDHLAAEGALLRPGCTESVDEKGVSLTEKYCRIKNGEEEYVNSIPVIEDIIKPTYGILCYQEQAMQICQRVAGFTLLQADNLRKACGKKLPEEMAKVKKMFLTQANELKIVTSEEADRIFAWIEKSQRYNFNSSHAYGYSLNTYRTAYSKAHLPLQFYCSSLKNADDQEEIRILVTDAKKFNIDVYPPILSDLKEIFYLDRGHIKFGMTNIRGIGASNFKKMRSTIEENQKKYGPISEYSWYQFLMRIGHTFPKNVMNSVIMSGSLRNLKKPRKVMEKDYEIITDLKPAEQTFLTENYEQWNSLKEALRGCVKHYEDLIEEDQNNLKISLEATRGEKKRLQLEESAKKRQDKIRDKIEVIESHIETLENRSTTIEDFPNEIASAEIGLLGVAITCNHTEGKITQRANATCKDYLDGKLPDYAVLHVLVEDVRITNIKRGKDENIGKEMAILRISDSSCSLEGIPCFAEQWKEFKNDLTVGRVVEMQLEKMYKKDGVSIKQIWTE